MPSLQDFGYASTSYSGEKDLLVILATMTGTTAKYPKIEHSAAYYENLIFTNPDQNINDFFKANSNNKLSLKHAGTLEVTLNPVDSELETRPRLGRIKELAIETGFDFTPYDINNDGQVSPKEFFILVIDNKTPNKGATRDTIPAAPSINPNLTLSCLVSVVGHRASFTLIAHELSHMFETVDLYADPNRNFRITLMGASMGSYNDMTSFHLDSWHKMRLGWVLPRIFYLNNGNATVRLFAPQLPDKYNTYILANKGGDASEFFMIEYRNNQLNGIDIYDSGVNGRGLIIWHYVQVTSLARPLFALGAPDLEIGGTIPWSSFSELETPPINWSSGHAANLRLRVLPSSPSNPFIDVEIISPGKYLPIIKVLAWAWVIVIGGFMITPGGIGCPACGPVWTTIIGAVSLAIGVTGIISEVRNSRG